MEGQTLLGEAVLTHNVPDGPVLVSPLDGDEPLDPEEDIKLIWEPVPAPNGSPIIGYQVLVVQVGSNFKAIPKPTFDIMLPATATSVEIPEGFLLSGAVYEWEVLAIEQGGNQTLSTSFFTTEAD